MPRTLSTYDCTIPVCSCSSLAYSFDARLLVMLVGSALTSLFLFHGIGLWTTLFGARRGDYYSTFGNDLSRPATSW